jgi:hypothetical protein
MLTKTRTRYRDLSCKINTIDETKIYYLDGNFFKIILISEYKMSVIC